MSVELMGTVKLMRTVVKKVQQFMLIERCCDSA